LSLAIAGGARDRSAITTIASAFSLPRLKRPITVTAATITPIMILLLFIRYYSYDIDINNNIKPIQTAEVVKIHKLLFLWLHIQKYARLLRNDHRFLFSN
jgi:hypothetical protein